MKEQIKNAIETIENRDFIMGYCESRQLSDALDLAIRSLQAWKEVLQELENMRDIIWQDTDNGARIVRANAWDKIEILAKAIDIINQKLEGVTENE